MSLIPQCFALQTKAVTEKKQHYNYICDKIFQTEGTLSLELFDSSGLCQWHGMEPLLLTGFQALTQGPGVRWVLHPHLQRRAQSTNGRKKPLKS